MVGDHRDQLKYHPYFCEENIWHLCATRSQGWAVFVSNPFRQVLMLGQRLEPRGLVWDYHVVYLAPDGNVLDFDAVHFSRPLDDWLTACFPDVPSDFRPRFKAVSAAEMAATFSSDRRHMRQNGRWLQPPPPWPCIGAGHDLDVFVQVDDSWMNTGELRGWAKKNVI